MPKTVKKVIKKTASPKMPPGKSPVKKVITKKVSTTLPARRPGEIRIGDKVVVKTVYRVVRLDDRLSMAVVEDHNEDRRLTFRNDELMMVKEFG